jgi:hypothetical protein
MAKKYTEIECLCQLNFEDGIKTVVAMKQPYLQVAQKRSDTRRQEKAMSHED